MLSPALATLVVLGTAPQRPVASAPPPPPLVLPDTPTEIAHAPFLSTAGTPLTATMRRFFTLDLDGDRVPDACWLGDAPGAHDLQLAMGREHSVGRFRAWPVPHGLPVSIRDAARFGNQGTAQDSLLIIDPAVTRPTEVKFDLATQGDPHLGGTFTSAPLHVIPARAGAIAVATANIEGDFYDDVAIVYDRGAQGSSIVKYRLDAPNGFLVLVSSSGIDVPWSVGAIELLDWDGDGTADVVAELPGFGVAVALDNDSPFLQPTFVLVAPSIDDLRAAPFGASSAVAIGVSAGVLTIWREGGQDQWHWLPTTAGTSVGQVALLPREQTLMVVAFAADGRSLRTQHLTRSQTPPAPLDVVHPNVTAYAGALSPCGCGTADVDGDGDTDLVLQHPDGEHWYTVRDDYRVGRPWLQNLTQDLQHVTAGWYLASYRITVPAHWDLNALPEIELQVMLEHPYLHDQRRGERWTAAIDPTTRMATFDVAWCEDTATWAAILGSPTPRAGLPGFLTNYAISGSLCQLNFMGSGPGNPLYTGSRRRTAPLVLFTNPTGGGNKSAQGIVWERRTAPPLPKADDAMLPWQ